MKALKGFFVCRRIRTTLLRAESGEASHRERERVRKHMAACAECRDAEAFLRSVASAWREREARGPDPELRERALRRALDAGAKEAPTTGPRLALPVLRWGALAATLTLCLLAAVLLREVPEPPHGKPPEVAKNLEWSNGVEKALARIGEQTAALRTDVLPVQGPADPVGQGLSRVELAVSDLRFSTREPWSYSMERRLQGVSAAAEDLVTNLDSL